MKDDWIDPQKSVNEGFIRAFGPDKTKQVNEFTMIEMKDIPPRMAEELERLHALLQTCPSNDWAKQKIDRIHQLFFLCYSQETP